MAHIYKITSPSNKIYIGSTINIERRKKNYRLLECKGQVRIYNSLKKYGWDNHNFEIITECDAEKMFSLEAYYGSLFDVLGKNGLNLQIPKHGEFFESVSDETKIKMSKGNKGKNLGKKASDETKLKLSNAKKGKKLSDKHKLNIIKSRAGYKHSDQTKCKMSETKKGKTFSESHKLKLSLTKRKKLINTKTGFIYDSLTLAALFLNTTKGTLGKKMNRQIRNDTDLKYL